MFIHAKIGTGPSERILVKCLPKIGKTIKFKRYPDFPPFSAKGIRWTEGFVDGYKKEIKMWMIAL